MYFKDKRYYINKLKEFLGMFTVSTLFVAILVFIIVMA